VNQKGVFKVLASCGQGNYGMVAGLEMGEE
jgi:hypothetical protein